MMTFEKQQNNDAVLKEFVENALKEDIGEGDHSSLSCIPANKIRKARLLIKEDGVIAGVEIAQKIFKQVDASLSLDILIKDGSEVKYGDVAFYVEGSARSILGAERLVLNCMQRMSGIATKARKLVDLTAPFGTKVLDTRKTTPGIRFLEKMAVKIGGGENHRFGLFDMIMLKDNHIDYAGGIAEAINSTNNYLKANNLNLKIEIEARNLEEVNEILKVGNIDRIMLDNFSYSDIRTAVKQIDKKYETEASGGITIDTIAEYAACGVDFISVGELTHSVKSLDMSLKAIG